MPVARYFDYGDTGVLSAGAHDSGGDAGWHLPVWTKRFGNNPRIKILLLHGGPGHGAWGVFFPKKDGFEFYEYDRLGAPYATSLRTAVWTTDRYVEEVEQVRKAIGADKENFYLLGNSLGGILGMSYALKYQAHLKGLIIANMVGQLSGL